MRTHSSGISCALVAAVFTFVAAPAHAQVDVTELTVAEIEAGLAASTYTSVSLTQAFLEQISTYESTYNAFVSLNPNALSIAAALDAEYAATGPRSPLHGVPVVVKDNMDYAGLVTANGYAGFSASPRTTPPSSNASKPPAP
jgi:Asp-tRNA(Asn)/Glu-tRNA(Gln) amidotransferase A subunit family amidase